ncbi:MULTISPECIES: D-xylose 1-dehydrogenase Gfo6 [Natrialbaceae]|uniref:D-xylose 1-dehydrogenase Gfo6 n=1 Tax=Natrialbaceae TaxID=1644061 RepID=UPI00207CB469|nr:D-xylose 1-dehydrogenase Gfo6 [Natronococcus sp. CG52]
MKERYNFTERDWYEPVDGGPVRIAVVGTGRFACRRALPAIRKTDLCEATIVVDLWSEKARAVAEAFDVPNWISSDEFKAGVAVETYDAVYVATPNAFHLPYVEAAARFGKSVLCEKPLDVSIDRAERMVRICEREDVMLMTGYRMQTEPFIRRMRELVADGFIGQPVHLTGKFSNCIDTDGGTIRWRNDPSIAGGGALMDLGIYPLNTIRFLLGRDPVRVYGSTASNHLAFEEVDEHVAFQLLFPDSVVASCTASLNAYPSSRLEIYGTEGEIQITSAFGGIASEEIVAERDGTRIEYAGPPVDEVREEFDYFAYCLLADQKPEPSGKDGVADLVIIEAIYESDERGRPISL